MYYNWERQLNYMFNALSPITYSSMHLHGLILTISVMWSYYSSPRIMSLPKVSDVSVISLSYHILVCRIILFLYLLTSVVSAGFFICQKCMMIHSSHYCQYNFIVFLQEYPPAGSDWRCSLYYVLNVILWFFLAGMFPAGNVGRFFYLCVVTLCVSGSYKIKMSVS